MVGIREVANRAKVSPGTVSRLLNGDPKLSIGIDTKKRIHLAVEELGYLHKSKEKKGRNHSIGLVTAVSIRDEFEDPYYRAVRLGIELEAKKQHIAANRIYRLQKGVEVKDLSDLGAVIILGQLDQSIVNHFYAQNTNLIIVDDPYCDEKFDAVYVDLKQATRKHLEQLYSAGHRKIAFIGGVRYIPTLKGAMRMSEDEIRLNTYRKWMHEKNLYTEDYESLGGWTTAQGFHLTESLLEKLDPEAYPTAILTANDPMAIGVYRALQKKKIRIPEDVSIRSYDDIEIAEFMIPSLTTARINTEGLGRFAIRLAKEKIEQEREQVVHLVLPTEIIERESSSSAD